MHHLDDDDDAIVCGRRQGACERLLAGSPGAAAGPFVRGEDGCDISNRLHARVSPRASRPACLSKEIKDS
jgi:hypothetical protein